MKKNAIALLVLLSLAIVFLILIFSRVLQNPNSYIYSTEGDAIKSYYNFSWYLRYDSGIRHDGINYPYGDHLQYINSHPLYLQIVKFIDRWIIPVSNYGVAILNLTMIFSLLLAVPFLFLILRKFALPRWYAVIISLIILFLSPQLDRIGGHFEMVYAFFIPLYWYLLIRWNEEKRMWLWGILLVCTALVGGFTSAYYAAFFLVFPLALLLVELWIKRKNLTSYYKKGFALLIIAVLPVIIVKGLVSLTDWVDDRPDNPWGFFIFHSNIWSIYLPFHSSLRALIGDYINMNYQWEGRAYVGLPATLLILSIGISVLHHLFTRKKLDYRLFFPNRKLNTWLMAAFLILLFSMCIPFKWGLRFLVDLIPSLKQFRCLGRFSWIFYYVFTVYTAYFFYVFSRRMKQKGMYLASSVVLVFALSFWTIDAGTNIKRSTGRIFNKNNILISGDTEYLTKFKDAGVDPLEFQAIFFLPFTNTSGDKLLHPRGMKAFTEAMKCSYHTGIPLIQSFSPRLSFQHALSSIQLLADTSIYKTRVDDMNNKPILLLITKEELNKQERWLKDQSQIFLEDENFYLARFPVRAFNNGYQNWVNYSRCMVDSLDCENEICSDSPDVFYDGFDMASGEHTFTGEGALYRKKGEIEVFNRELYSPEQGEPLELSFWLFVDSRTFNMPEAELHLWDKENKHLERIKIETREVYNVYDHWVRIQTRISPDPGIRYQLLMKGKFITVDDLLIRPADSNVLIRKAGDFDLFNNFPLEK